MTTGIHLFKKSCFVSGTWLDGYEVITSSLSRYGKKIIGPTDRAMVISNVPSLFSGVAYTILTETAFDSCGNPIDSEDSLPIFESIIMSDRSVLKADRILDSYRTQPVQVSEIKKGDLIVSLPSFVERQKTTAVQMDINGHNLKCVVVRVSNLIKREYKNIQSNLIQMNGEYFCLDGIAVKI